MPMLRFDFAQSNQSMLLLLGLLAIFIFVGVVAGRKTRRLPGPPSHSFLLNNSLEVLSNLPRMLDWLLENSVKYGGEGGLGAWTFQVTGQPRMTVFHDPELVRHVLTNVNTYGKGPIWRANFSALLGDGIFSADFDNWLTQRKRAANMFKITNFKHSMLEAVRTKCLKLMSILKEDIQKKGDGKTMKVDMQEHFFKLTLDTIGEIAFGRDLGSLSGKNVEFMRAFDYCQQYTSDLFFKPGPCWIYNNFTPRGWRYNSYVKVLDQYGATLVKEMIQQSHMTPTPLEEGEGVLQPEKETILSFFLAKESDASLNDKKTIKYLTDVIMNFQIAGRDTVAQAFSWAIYLLSQHPEIQERVYQEARTYLTVPTEASFDQIQKLEYTHAVITETLRLYPSVPKEGKWAYKNDVLPDGTPISKNTFIIFAPYVMGRLDSLWPDALTFDPERHLGKPKPSSFLFTAFQAGPRICLGQNLAYMQLQYGLALLLLSFHITPIKDHQVAPVQNTVTLPMQDGVRVHLTLRD